MWIKDMSCSGSLHKPKRKVYKQELKGKPLGSKRQKVIRKNIKAQAALEFLTTYGWAFLVILIMIGTLAYFGILSPSGILPNRCTFGAEFQCIDYKLTSNSLDLRIKNNVGEAITATSITFNTEAITNFTCSTNPTPPSSWRSSEVVSLAWSGCTGGGLTSGEKGKIGLTITYYNAASSSTYSKQVKGEVYAAVQ